MIEVGEFIRAIRKRRNLTTTQLAVQLDLSNGYISLIERNIVSPSLATLKRIAQTLNVPLESFFLDPDTEVIYGFLKGHDQYLNTEGSGWYQLIDNSKTDLMGASLIDSETIDKEVYAHQGMELIYVLEGETSISIRKEDYELKAEDSMYFDASIMHWYKKEPHLPLKIISVAIPPRDFHSNS